MYLQDLKMKCVPFCGGVLVFLATSYIYQFVALYYSFDRTEKLALKLKTEGHNNVAKIKVGFN